MSFLVRSSKGSRIASLLLSALCLLSILGNLTLFAQQDAGGLLVSVRDPNGAVVQGAKVVGTNIDTNQTMEGATNHTGDDTAIPLRPGRKQTILQQTCLQTTNFQAWHAMALPIPT